MSATIRFSDVDEFIDELRKDFIHIEHGIVRVTRTWRPSRETPAIQHVSVVATAIVRGHIVRFERCFGDDWGPNFAGPSRDAILRGSEEALRTLEDYCQKAGLHFRAGIFESDEAA